MTQYNPWQIAEHAAKNSRASPDKALSLIDRVGSTVPNEMRTTKKNNIFNREQKAVSVNRRSKSPVKRKADVHEDGEVRTKENDVEVGEVVEGAGELEEGFEEVIQDGKVWKMRKLDD